MTTIISGSDMLVAKYASSDTDDTKRAVPLEDDILAFLHISDKFLAFELELYATKWFDYRMLTGVQATRAYIDAYGAVYKDVYARELDYERAQFVKPLNWETIKAGLDNSQDEKALVKAKKIYSGCWRGRQVADALGMPYAVYIEMAFTCRMRRWKQRHLPQPSHLFHEYDVEKIQTRWADQQETILYTSEHPAFMVQNYAGIAYQNDYHEWLLKQAMARSNPASFLARFIENNQLQLEKVESRMPPEIYQQVEALIS